MGFFEESILIIGLLIGGAVFCGFIVWSSATARQYYAQENLGELEEENRRMKKANKEGWGEKKEDEKTTKKDEVLPKGFKKDTDDTFKDSD